MTPWERKLWYLFLRNYPIKIYKQKPVGRYVLDFYCPSVKIAFELDGSGHFFDEQKQYDELRTQWLNSIGIKVLRINNNDIDKNFEGVKEYIDRMLQHSVNPLSVSH